MATTITSVRRLVAVAAGGCVALALAVQLPALAAPGAGTWTRVTSPANGTVVLRQSGHEGHWTITGRASSGVSEVNVYCLRGSGSSVSATTVATAVGVTSGAFSQTVPVPTGVASPQCRLRALPDGVNPQAAYVASYAGPVVNLDSWTLLGGTGFQLTASAGATSLVAGDAGSCSVANLAPVAVDQTVPGGSGGCVLSLAQNADDNGPAVVVDGHDAYPPADATRFGVTPLSTVHATFRATGSGGVRWTDEEPLDRCTSDVAFPPTGSCTLRTTGVELRQVTTLLTSGRVQLRDEYLSTDGRRHVLHLAPTSVISTDTDGELGVRFPGQNKFHAATLGEKVTHLGRGARTMLVRTDRFADEGDPTVATRALTWSRPPSRIVFSSSEENTFELDYRLVVPKGGSVHLGFADGVNALTAGAEALSARARRGMMPAPRITSPVTGSVVKGDKTKVTGVVTQGANGLPVSVMVNGHSVKLKPSKSGSRATFTLTLTEAAGKHTITVLAKDAGGNKRSTTIHITTK